MSWERKPRAVVESFNRGERKEGWRKKKEKKKKRGERETIVKMRSKKERLNNRPDTIF